MKHILHNWKTSLAGLLAIAGTIIATWFPEYAEDFQKVTVIAVGMGLVTAKDGNRTGIARVFLLGGCLLFLPSCGSLPDGTKTFLGMTSGQYLTIGGNIVKREALPVAAEVQDARAVTAAKNPVNVQ